jgi:Porin subfamily
MAAVTIAATVLLRPSTAHAVVKYVRICLAFDLPGFYYLPGTDICVNPATNGARQADGGRHLALACSEQSADLDFNFQGRLPGRQSGQVRRRDQREPDSEHLFKVRNEHPLPAEAQAWAVHRISPLQGWLHRLSTPE